MAWNWVGAITGAAELGLKIKAARSLASKEKHRDKALRKTALGEIKRQREQFEEDWRRRTEREKQTIAARGMGQSSQYESQMTYLRETGQRRLDSFAANVRRINIEYRYARAKRQIGRKMAYAAALGGISQTAFTLGRQQSPGNAESQAASSKNEALSRYIPEVSYSGGPTGMSY